MTLTITLLLAVCSLVQSSGVGLVAQPDLAPVVTAASSQYFERTFNRLVAAPPLPAPVFPVASPPQLIPVAQPPPVVPFAQVPAVIAAPQPPLPIPSVPNLFRVVPVPRVTPQPANPVFIQPTTKNNQEPSVPVNPPLSTSSDPNVAIAVATANAAAPVATILLPPYPFGPPPSFGFIPSSPTFTLNDKREKESTTENQMQSVATTTEKQKEFTTPVPSNIDNNFVQALPSNENVNFKQYLPPPFQLPLEPTSPPLARMPMVNPQLPRPQKVKTSVEVVPVPLTYIAPPQLKKNHPVKIIKIHKHVHTFIPSGKIVIRPVSHKVLSVGNSAYALAYRKPVSAKNVAQYPKIISKRTKSRDVEPITLRTFSRPGNEPRL
ncbi:uncharacterized protein [Battus philenor]|uniref:uncharacterized protein n=1 Tax=Battus philenor TaxID=42288 RepID=UPI0035CE8CFB